MNEENWPRPAVAWYGVLVLMLAYILSFVDRVVIGLLVGPIRADLGISETQMSLLYGFVFALFYTGLGVPIAWAIDRYNRRNIIAVGIAVWSGMTALCGVARGFGELALARIGVARLLSSVGSNDLPADVSARRRALEATPRAASSFAEEFLHHTGKFAFALLRKYPKFL